MQRMRRRILALVFAFILCFSGLTAFAHDVPDFGRKGSVSLAVIYDGVPVPGGSMTLYHVGSIDEYDGNYRFVLTEEFVGSNVDLSDIGSKLTASLLADYVSTNSLKGITSPIDAYGKVSFKDLELGLYLLVQQEIPDGYSAVSPFLVSVPMVEDGSYVYDVAATPKVQLSKAETPPTTPATPGTPNPPVPTGTQNPPVPTGPTLPQTGQLNWPIPVLVIAGLVFFSLGWELRFGKKKEEYEE